MEATTTNTDGAFTIPLVSTGGYYVDVAAPGYISPLRVVDNSDLFSADAATRARVQSLVPNVNINGSDTATIEVRLDRGAAISGTVFFDDGTPASNLRITATQKVDPPPVVNGRNRFGNRNSFGANSTDDQGHFRVYGLLTGDYIISATFMPDGVRIANPTPNTAAFRSGGTPLTIYAPRAFTPTAAAVTSVKAGSERTGVDITLPIHALHGISGFVAAAAHTITGGQLSLTGLDDQDFRSNTQINEDGSFQFNFIPEGRYTLAVTYASDAPPRGPGRSDPRRPPPSDSFGPAQTTVTLHTGDLTGVTLTVPQLQSTTAQQ